ncbi:MAG: very short patch repair endonuclease [Hyphomonadaceae bacterium]|nr:very short patch repair endonuclease [Hyphomonadaceae bacterium]
MADRFSHETRSKAMAAVRGKDTSPERYVRSSLHAAGFRFRLHRRDLPGRPDIVLKRFRTAVFVHGCFWHGHDCPKGKRPVSNVAFWNAKLERNAERDRAAVAALGEAGWRVHVLWECSLGKATQALISTLRRRRAHAARNTELAR